MGQASPDDFHSRLKFFEENTRRIEEKMSELLERLEDIEYQFVTPKQKKKTTPKKLDLIDFPSFSPTSPIINELTSPSSALLSTSPHMVQFNRRSSFEHIPVQEKTSDWAALTGNTTEEPTNEEKVLFGELYLTILQRGIKIFTGNANPGLARKIAKHIREPLGECSVGKFSNGEISVTIKESTRDFDVYIIQSTSNPNVNDNLMELLIMIDAVKRASARRITAVIPFFGYARQDKKDKSRAPITSKLVANLLETAGADRIITMDLHASQIQGFFDVPVDNLYAEKLLVYYIKEQIVGTKVIVSPDAGGVKRAKSVADKVGVDLAIIHKERKKANRVDNMTLVGDVSGQIAILVDDMADTCGTLAMAAATLIREGATKVYALCSHGVLSGNAVEKIQQSPIEELVITNSISLSEEAKKCKKIKCIDVAPMFGQAILRTHNGQSISALFEQFFRLQF